MASTPHSEEPSTSQSSATTSREAMSGEGGDEGDGRSEQRLQRNQSIFPNLPTPVNGRIKTYGTAHRSFSRPYSAKTVFFYKEGDEHFAGVRVPVSKSRYRNIDALLDDLNTNIQMPFGVRRLMTPGRTPIVHIDQLEHLGKYVVSSSRFGKGVDFEALEKIHKARELAQKNFRGNEGFWNPTSPNFKAKLRMGRSLGLSFLPLTAKQMFFVLNGNRTRIYRALLNPLKAIDFDALLEEVSEGLQTAIFKLYAYDGTRITNVEQLFAMKEARVLAVPRNERPIFKSADSEELMGNGVAQKSYLPPISKTQFYASNTASTSKTQITNPSGPRRQIKPSNSIERAPASTARSKPTMGLTRGATNGILPSRIPRVDDPTTSKKKAVAKPRLKRTGTAPPPVIVEKQQANQRLPPISRSSVSNTADDSDSGRPRSTEYDWKEEDEEETAEALKRPPTTYEEDYDDDPERPRSKASILEDRIEAGGGGRLSGMEEKTDEEEEEEDRGREDGEEEAGRTEEDISLRSRGEAPETPSRVEESEEEKVKGGDREEEELEEGDYQEDPPLQEDYTSGGTHYVDPQERAAVKIQAWARGNFARKTLNLERDDDRYDEEDDEHIHDQHEAALVIQSHYRGYRTRRELKDGTYKFVNEGRLVPKEEIPMEEEVMGQEELRETLEQLEQLQHIPEEDEHQHEEEPEPTEDKRDEIDEDLRPEEEFPITVDVPPETAHNPRPPETDGNTYSVVVHTGDRTGAGTEADLYIILHGEGGKSEKMPLKQETEAAPKFRENSVDFFLLHCRFLGTLTKIVVGHEIHGYGAGVFIDYVTVNENVHDGRQYLFNCYKWFDSGMVDGKIERTLKMTAYSYVASIPEDYRITRGNWELILHSGDKHGNGATTSRLNIIGYGTEGKSEKLNIYEENLSKVPSTSLVQVDFGKIGELTKVRIEIEGHGNQPDYYLNFVELKDLDTEERLVVNCGKWLRWNKGDEKHAQSFRDLVIFRAGEKKAPLPVFTYEGKLRIMTSSIKSCDEEVRIELISKNDETGIFPVVLENRDGDSYDVSFKVDAVDIGDVLCAQIYFSPTLIGEEIYEGISCVHEILHKHDAMPDAVNSYWIVSYLTVRKSNHFPQRRVLKRSRCRPLAERNASYVKQLYYVKTEEMTTRISKKKKAIQGPKESHWMLSMKLREDSTVLPEVILCSRETEVKMDVISREMVDGVVNYEKKGNIGTITKIRVGMDSFSYVKGKEKATPEVSFILKMRLVDSANGDELPFPDPYVALQPHNSICVIEFPATWPDSEPPKGIVYEVYIQTKASNGSFRVKAKLIGERGLHSGFRKLEEPGVDDLFAEDTERMLRLQALHLGELKAIEIDVEASKSGEPFEWECAEIRVVNTGNLHYYEFDCGTTFTNENRQQLFSVAPIPIAHSV